jgi:hypothetical protein
MPGCTSCAGCLDPAAKSGVAVRSRQWAPVNPSCHAGCKGLGEAACDNRVGRSDPYSDGKFAVLKFCRITFVGDVDNLNRQRLRLGSTVALPARCTSIRACINWVMGSVQTGFVASAQKA